MRVDIGKLYLEVELRGDPATQPAVILIQGLGTPLTRWPVALLDRLQAAGLAVVSFDNRDIGRSVYMDELGCPDLSRLRTQNPWALSLVSSMISLPYRLSDMADDTVRLMDALKIREAHVVGASMGGMIAQIVAACHSRRCLSLTSIMSSSGNPLLPPPKPTALAALFAPLPLQHSEAALVADAVRRQKALMSPGYPMSDAELSAFLTAEFRRGFHPAGVARQLAALVLDGDRRALIAGIRAPTMVLHGEDDPLIPLACGRDTARHIPGAEFFAVPGMGHDFPPALAPVFAETILKAVEYAG